MDFGGVMVREFGRFDGQEVLKGPAMHGGPRECHGETQHQREIGLRQGRRRIVTGGSDEACADFSERTPAEKERYRKPQHRAPPSRRLERRQFAVCPQQRILGGRGCRGGIRAYGFLDFLRRYGGAPIEPLVLIAPQAAQSFQLLSRLDALGDDLSRKLCASEMMAPTMAAASALVVKSPMKLRSILSLSMESGADSSCSNSRCRNPRWIRSRPFGSMPRGCRSRFPHCS